MKRATLEVLADKEHVEQLVGEKPAKRWTRASLTLRGYDGVSRETFFCQRACERVEMVRNAMLEPAPFMPLLQVDIPKKHGSNETRPICFPTVIDAARLYLLTAWLTDYAETVLTRTAIGFRPGRSMIRSVLSALKTIRKRRLHYVCVIDVRKFYDSISWEILDAVVGELPADRDVKQLLHDLFRIQVWHPKKKSWVERDKGISQGLSISPVIANLALANLDKVVAHQLSLLGAIVLRYADDIAIFAPTAEAAEKARAIVVRELEKLRLTVKPATGEIKNLSDPKQSASWLGLAMSTVALPNGGRAVKLSVPDKTIEEKAGELRDELEAGITTLEDADRRIDDLQRFYTAVMSEREAQLATRKIKTAVHRPGLTAKGKGQETNGRKEAQRTIENMIGKYPPHTAMDEDRGSGGSGRGSNGFSLCSHGREGVRSQREEATVKSGASHRASHDQDRKVGDWELCRSEGLRPVVPGGSTGAAVRPAPVNSGQTRPAAPTWIVRVKPQGPTRASMLAVGGDGSRWCKTVEEPLSKSVPEVVLVAYATAVRALAGRGARAIRLEVRDPIIEGYIARGWRVGSFAILRRLRDLQRVAVGIRIELVVARQAREAS